APRFAAARQRVRARGRRSWSRSSCASFLIRTTREAPPGSEAGVRATHRFFSAESFWLLRSARVTLGPRVAVYCGYATASLQPRAARQVRINPLAPDSSVIHYVLWSGYRGYPQDLDSGRISRKARNRGRGNLLKPGQGHGGG